mmetsp:Transcript_6542/g.12727  ORF Transcript_6542/g.12727 Transcript_6542/m.12727 type:complete len:188 (+) Transcript_6542:1603-2166(+)
MIDGVAVIVVHSAVVAAVVGLFDAHGCSSNMLCVLHVIVSFGSNVDVHIRIKNNWKKSERSFRFVVLVDLYRGMKKKMRGRERAARKFRKNKMSEREVRGFCVGIWENTSKVLDGNKHESCNLSYFFFGKGMRIMRVDVLCTCGSLVTVLLLVAWRYRDAGVSKKPQEEKSGSVGRNARSAAQLTRR